MKTVAEAVEEKFPAITAENEERGKAQADYLRSRYGSILEDLNENDAVTQICMANAHAMRDMGMLAMAAGRMDLASQVMLGSLRFLVFTGVIIGLTMNEPDDAAMERMFGSA